MRVLVACEWSGTVRDAFIDEGHEAWSCDLLPTEGAYTDRHYQCDALEALIHAWDLVVAFPPCTHLCSSGARWWPEKQADGRQREAIDFFMQFTRLDCPWAIENPVGIMSSVYCKPDQIIQPWQFGHGEVKTTCLWLNGLPRLEPTNVVEGKEQKCWKMPPSEDRGKKRGKTYTGIAKAMAEQWGTLSRVK